MRNAILTILMCASFAAGASAQQHVGGAPIPLFARLGSAGGLHLLPIDLNQTLAQTYLPDQFFHVIYPALVPVEETVPTLAVGDGMAVFAWQPHTERYNKAAHQ